MRDYIMRYSILERSLNEISDKEFGTPLGPPVDAHLTPYRPVSWDDLLKSARILIVSTAGSGKTYECRQRQRLLWKRGEPAFFVELGALAMDGLQPLLKPEERARLKQWRNSQSSFATVFLDSIDELKLTQASFRAALTKLANELEGQLARIRIVLTSRPIPIERDLIAEILPVPQSSNTRLSGRQFANAVLASTRQSEAAEQAPAWRTVELLPLSTDHIRSFAAGQEIADPDAFVADLRARRVEEFAERPQDLLELCAQWRERRCVTSYRDQVEGSIKAKLQPRTGRNERTGLSPDRAIEGAGRLALAAILTRRLIFRHSAESDLGGSSRSVVDPAPILFDWTHDEVETLLGRGLFGFASYGRVRFQHRSAIEYLSAKRLGQYLAAGKPIAAIKRLLFAKTAQGDRIVRPTMRPVAAWLALESESIFSEVCERDPTLLLNFGDPDLLSESQRARALTAYVERHGSGGWRRLDSQPLQVSRFATPALGPLVQRLWPGVENPEVRALLLHLVEAAKIRSCADIAFQAASNPAEMGRVRLNGLDALAAINDPRMDEVLNSLEVDAIAWPPDIARQAIVQLFPERLSVERLLKALQRLAGARDEVGFLGSSIAHRIKTMEAAPASLAKLTQGLFDLIGQEIRWSPVWPPYNAPRGYLAPALAAASMRQMPLARLEPRLADAVSLALRLGKEDEALEEHVKSLREAVARMGAADRETLFWAADRFSQSCYPVSDSRQRLIGATHHAKISLTRHQDFDWVLAALSDKTPPADHRAVLLEAALRDVWDKSADDREYADRVRDCAGLVAIIEERLRPTPINAELAALEEQSAQTRKEKAEQRVTAHESWMSFWHEISNTPDLALAPARVNSTMWNIWQAMSRSSNESQSSGWNRPFLEQYFDEAAVDRMRDALRPLWRKDCPTLRSERAPNERNSFLRRWQLGAAAVAAEAEDRGWACSLTPSEASLACRYVPIHLNGFPAWLDDVLEAHPNEVDAVLGNELSLELVESAEGDRAGASLHQISQAAGRVAASFLPRLRAWLDEHGARACHDGSGAAAIARVETVLGILLKHGDGAMRQHLAATAADQLTRRTGSSTGRVWLPVLMTLDPEQGTSLLEDALEGLPPSPSREAPELFAALFGERSEGQTVILSNPGFTPQILLRLVRAAHRHIRVEDDLSYSDARIAIARDHAELARHSLLNALLQSKGVEAWTAKCALAREPSFVLQPDRLLAIARDVAAQEADGEPLDTKDVEALERYGEAPPRTRDDMFQLMNDRLDGIEDLLLQDVSPREEWSLLDQERLMRRAISRALKAVAKQSYTISQEAVTADEKETDIRFHSVASNQQGTIELKLGDKNWSASDLRRALKHQLVEQYMAADDCRAGILLITLAKSRHWRHPDDDRKIGFSELIALLNEDAGRITNNMGAAVRVAVRGLDLRSRLPA